MEARRSHIEKLFVKAAHDMYVLDRLVEDDQAPVDVFGFHAQQAAEKLLKAVVVAACGHYPRTHRLAELIDLLKSAGIDVPPRFEEIRHLTPFAVEFRYDVVPEEDESPLDKPGIRQMLQDVRDWAERKITESLGPVRET